MICLASYFTRSKLGLMNYRLRVIYSFLDFVEKAQGIVQKANPKMSKRAVRVEVFTAIFIALEDVKKASVASLRKKLEKMKREDD